MLLFVFDGVGAGPCGGFGGVGAVNADGDVKADGTFQPDLKGIESGHLGLRYSEATGTEITGDVTLGKDPGIKSGRSPVTT